MQNLIVNVANQKLLKNKAMLTVAVTVSKSTNYYFDINILIVLT